MVQNRERNERKRAAGSQMGFLNVGRAFVAVWQRTRTDHVQLLVCAGRRVINRSQIPLRAAIRCARGFASLRLSYAMQNFDSVATQPSLRMTLGGRCAALWVNLEGRVLSKGDHCIMLTYHVFRPEQGINEAGKALSDMLAEESPGKSYADAMRARVSGVLAGECTDTYFVALDVLVKIVLVLVLGGFGLKHHRVVARPLCSCWKRTPFPSSQGTWTNLRTGTDGTVSPAMEQ